MGAILGPVALVAGKAALSIFMALVNEDTFKDLFLWLVDKGVASTKNTWDDELAAKIHAAVDKAGK